MEANLGNSSLSQVQQDCGFAVWRTTPLEQQPTQLQNYDPTQSAYYTKDVIAKAWPSVVGLGFFVLLLLGFVVWRVFRWCCGVRPSHHIPSTVATGQHIPMDMRENAHVVVIKGHDGDEKKEKSQPSTCVVAPDGRLIPTHHRVVVRQTSPDNGMSYDGMQSSKAGQKLQSHSEFQRGVRAWNTGMFIFLLGVLAGSIYALVNVHPYVVNDGLVPEIENAINYADSVLQSVEGSIEAGKELDSVLANIESNLSAPTVQPLAVQSDIQCITPWLNALPSPQLLTNDANALINGASNVAPRVSSISDTLGTLMPRKGFDPNSQTLSNISNSKLTYMEAVLSAPTIFSEVSKGATDLSNAISNLNQQENRAQMLQVQEYMMKISISDTMKYLQTLLNAITGISEAVNILALSVPDAIQRGQNLIDSSEAETLQTIYSQQYEAYMGIKKCLDSILKQARSITGNPSLQIPPDIQQFLNLVLQVAKDMDSAFSPVVRNDIGPNGILQSLNQSLSVAGNFSNDLVSLANSLGANGSLSATLNSLTTSLQQQINSLSSLMPQFQSIETELQDYEKMMPGSQRTALYQTIYTQLKLLQPATTNAVTALNSWLNELSPLIANLNTINQQYQTHDIPGLLSEVESTLKSVQSGGISAFLSDYAYIYTNLPQIQNNLSGSLNSYVSSISSSVSSTISGIRNDLQGILGTTESGVQTARLESVDRVQGYVDEYQPTASTYDTWRMVVMYVLLSLIIIFSILVFITSVIWWPFGLSTTIFLTVLLMCISFAIVVAFTAGLKIGSDTCYNIEGFLLEKITDPTADTVLRYYFDGGNGTVTQVADAALGININQITNQIEGDKSTILSETQGLILTPTLQNEVTQSLFLIDTILGGINTTLGMLEYSQAYPQYANVKDFVCCDAMNSLGNAWLGLIITGCFSFFMMVTAFIVLSKFDLIPCSPWWGRIKK